MMAEEGGECPVQAQAAAVASSTGQELSPRANAKGKRRSDKKEQSCKLRYVFIFPHYRCVYQDVRRKRPPKRLSQRPNDIYVNRNSDFSGQLARSHKLLDQGAQELFIHGLGAAIHRAINLALQLKETSSHSLEVSCTTSTVELVDDLEPLDDESDFKTQTRPSSAIHIRLYKTPPPATPTQNKTTPTQSKTTPTNTTGPTLASVSTGKRPM
ncbi:Ribonuclease P protein subunit p20 [Geodia barretti]|uniref:Ribonuclease P protein subunit p20 n=1 Tax=Geodia barretti TaxID=519541 RepID=A0AA35TP94_GEOBA|nr:Ribonuclease P protein subunit p20 [Geodia barretti]